MFDYTNCWPAINYERFYIQYYFENETFNIYIYEDINIAGSNLSLVW